MVVTKDSRDLKHWGHPAFSQVSLLVNDIRLDFDQGKGTLAEVADRLIEAVLNPLPTVEYKPLRLREPEPKPDPIIETLHPGDRIYGTWGNEQVTGVVRAGNPERDSLLLMDAGVTPPPVLRWDGQSQMDVTGIVVVQKSVPEARRIEDNPLDPETNRLGGHWWCPECEGQLVDPGHSDEYWYHLSGTRGDCRWTE